MVKWDKYVGVERAGTRYRARIRLRSGRVRLGPFSTAKQAAKAYDEQVRDRISAHTSARFLNFPTPKEAARSDGKRSYNGRICSSMVKGVHYDKRCGKWRVALSTGHGQQLRLGYYETAKDAVRACLKASRMTRRKKRPSPPSSGVTLTGVTPEIFHDGMAGCNRGSSGGGSIQRFGESMVRDGSAICEGSMQIDASLPLARSNLVIKGCRSTPHKVGLSHRTTVCGEATAICSTEHFPYWKAREPLLDLPSGDVATLTGVTQPGTSDGRKSVRADTGVNALLPHPGCTHGCETAVPELNDSRLPSSLPSVMRIFGCSKIFEAVNTTTFRRIPRSAPPPTVGQPGYSRCASNPDISKHFPGDTARTKANTAGSDHFQSCKRRDSGRLDRVTEPLPGCTVASTGRTSNTTVTSTADTLVTGTINPIDDPAGPVEKQHCAAILCSLHPMETPLPSPHFGTPSRNGKTTNLERKKSSRKRDNRSDALPALSAEPRSSRGTKIRSALSRDSGHPIPAVIPFHMCLRSAAPKFTFSVNSIRST